MEARVGQAGGDFLEVAVQDGFLRAIGVVVVNERAVGEHDVGAGVAKAYARASAGVFILQVKATHDGDARVVGRDEVGFGGADGRLGQGGLE